MSAGLAIYDTMRYVKPDISTLCMGQAASMGALLLAAGTEGKRYALPNARILIHQPMGSFQGAAADVAIQAKEILRMRETLNDILAFHTHQDIETIRRDTDRDFYMSGQEAKDYSIVDHVITQRKAAPTFKDKKRE